MMPTVLIGIVTRNRASILPKAVSSALAQRGCPIRISVIDDGSSDATAEIARQFPTVEWICWAPSRGYMVARNHWMSSASEDYFVSLDDDAWFLKGDEIALAVDFMERNRDVAAVGFDILSPDHPDPAPSTEPRPAAMFIGCGHVLRISAVRAVGVYESAPGSYGGEEKDLSLRLMDAGSRVVLLPGVHVWHDKTSLARDAFQQYCSGVCNDLIMAVRRTPLALLPVAILSKACQHLLHSWKCGLSSASVEGFTMFLRSAPAAFRTRRPVKLSTLRDFVRLSRPVDPSSCARSGSATDVS